MITVESMRGKTAAVLGLAASGLACCRGLEAGGATVWAWDDAEDRRQTAAAAGIPIVCLAQCNWQRVDRLVLSPGIPQRHPRPHPLVRRARRAGVPVVGDLELLVENQPARQVIGITGTNGKSTTTALVAELLAHAGRSAQRGGNIGLPVLDLLPKPLDDIYVLELSSFQLELTDHLACAIAVILNTSPDHLERHGGMAGYVRAKRRILRNQQANHCAVIGIDDTYGSETVDILRRRGSQRVIPVSARAPVEGGVFVREGRLLDATDGPPREAADLRAHPSLVGEHNWQNAAAAFAVLRALGVDADVAAGGMTRFRGLAHRMETVAEVDGIRYVNDSKATNAAAAARSLASYDDIYWIAGGRAKAGGLDGLGSELDRVRHAFLIGKAAEPFAASLEGRVPVTISGDLETALADAERAARRDGRERRVVLLAPACASFDQFTSFEARGDAFRELVRGLIGAGAPA